MGLSSKINGGLTRKRENQQVMLKWLIFMMRPGEEAARVDNIWIIPMEKGTGNVALETGGGMTSRKQAKGGWVRRHILRIDAVGVMILHEGKILGLPLGTRGLKMCLKDI